MGLFRKYVILEEGRVGFSSSHFQTVSKKHSITERDSNWASETRDTVPDAKSTRQERPCPSFIPYSPPSLGDP